MIRGRMMTLNDPLYYAEKSLEYIRMACRTVDNPTFRERVLEIIFFNKNC